MAALDYLTHRGFAARLRGKRIALSPASRLTDDVRRYVKSHRLEILAELASNDGQARKMHWQISVKGKQICTMIGEPMTYGEALEAARFRWPEAEIV
ncbi:hypothetical protein IQ22_00403 [Pseudomonas duriflava]|uniref:TubC N-terminal docking domain-containing protein n=1 Tax=Pseudomonas duriflava TaxID=459528 RepID=A0A562QPS0_9PSED|nr:hypothetical protein [Pseudomonas duriflava]TWI58695.1 hypothetical protein IQ22_00403 [Pseudomonas duriflava]